MFFDAVIRISDREVMFNGTPEETKKYLLKNPQIHSDVEVCLGKTLAFMSVYGYLH